MEYSFIRKCLLPIWRHCALSEHHSYCSLDPGITALRGQFDTGQAFAAEIE